MVFPFPIFTSSLMPHILQSLVSSFVMCEVAPELVIQVFSVIIAGRNLIKTVSFIIEFATLDSCVFFLGLGHSFAQYPFCWHLNQVIFFLSMTFFPLLLFTATVTSSVALFPVQMIGTCLPYVQIFHNSCTSSCSIHMRPVPYHWCLSLESSSSFLHTWDSAHFTNLWWSRHSSYCPNNLQASTPALHIQ